MGHQGTDSWGAGEALIIGTSALDIGITEYMLQNVPGAYEANPLLQNQTGRILLKSGVTAGAVWLHRHYKKKGERKKARFVVIGTSLLWGLAFAFNASQL